MIMEQRRFEVLDNPTHEDVLDGKSKGTMIIHNILICIVLIFEITISMYGISKHDQSTTSMHDRHKPFKIKLCDS